MEKLNQLDQFLLSIKEEHNIPGLTVAIVKKGQLILSKGYGYSNINNKIHMTPDTVLSIQSISKSFSSTAIMKLVEKELIDLNTPLVNYLPYFRTFDKEKSDKITVKNLLSHTAGFPGNAWIATLQDDIFEQLAKNFPEISEMLNQSTVTKQELEGITNREDITRYFSKLDLEYNPGVSWGYSSDSYVIVGDLIEKVTGETWENFMKDEIFLPLNLGDTYTDPVEVLKHDNVAQYYKKNNNGELILVPFPKNTIAGPIGFIYSTARDLSNYLIANMNSNYNSVISKRSIDRMQEEIGEITDTISYGFGWMIRRHDNGSKIVEHSGGYPGVSSLVTMLPEKEIGIVILSNCEHTPLNLLSEKMITMSL